MRLPLGRVGRCLVAVVVPRPQAPPPRATPPAHLYWTSACLALARQRYYCCFCCSVSGRLRLRLLLLLLLPLLPLLRVRMNSHHRP